MPALNAAPISAREAEQAFLKAGLSRGDTVAVGVSGGADSVALALLAHAFLNVTTFTVDHGLRPESADEAEAVSALMAHYGIAHTILVWDGLKPRSNIMARAREARYRLLGDACRDAGLKTLLVAHHRGDQSETLLMRLLRGVGLKGLSGMRVRRQIFDQGLDIVRPFLDVPKARLISTLVARGVDWIEDPTNQDLGYERVRVRRLLADLDAPDEVEARLAASARALARADEAVDFFTRKLIDATTSIQPGDWIDIDADLFYAEDWPDEVRLRAWSWLVGMVGGHNSHPPFEAINRLDQIFAGVWSGQKLSETLALVRVVSLKNGRMCMVREAGRMEPRKLSQGVVHAKAPGHWDLELDVHANGLEIRALGEDGWAQVKPHIEASGHAALTWPLPVKWACAAIFDDECLVAVPMMGYIKPEAPLTVKDVRPVLGHKGLWSDLQGLA